MGLDARGDISIVIIIAYIPVFIFSLLLSLRHGFSRDAGWVFLLIFSVGQYPSVLKKDYNYLTCATVRIVGGALHIAAEEISPPSIGVYIGAFALESSGVAPLLLCTTSFLGVMYVRSRLESKHASLLTSFHVVAQHMQSRHFHLETLESFV